MFNYLKMIIGVSMILLNGIFIQRPQQRFVSGIEIPTNRQQFTQFTQFKCDDNPVCAISQPSKSFSVASKAQCVLYCQQRRQQPESCVGVNYKEQKSTCEVFNYEVYRFKKNVTGCQYIQKGSSETLNCKYIPLPRDCSDMWNLTDKMQNVSGVYTVFVGNDERPLSVYCEMTTTDGWTVFQRRQDGSVDFYRNWDNYTTGFGNLTGEFWIGNDNLNLLTTAKRYKLRVDLSDFNGNTAYAEYDNFVVNPSTDKYKLSSIGNYSGTAGDSLSFHIKDRFSTFDQSNDGRNSSETYKGAWWYHYGAYHSNLNGQFKGGQFWSASGLTGINWYSWGNNWHNSFKSVMKIKPFN